MAGSNQASKKAAASTGGGSAVPNKASHSENRSRARIIWRRWGDWRKLALAAGVTIVLAALLSIQYVPGRLTLRAGDVAPRDIHAPRTIRFYDANQTEALRRLVARQVAPMYSSIVDAAETSRESVARFFDKARDVRSAAGGQPLTRRMELLWRTAPELPRAAVLTALTLPEPQLDQAESAAMLLVERVMQQPIRSDGLEDSRLAARRTAQSEVQPASAKQLVGEIVASSLTINQFYNKIETEEAQRREREKILPQYVTIRQGDLVVRAGDRLTLDHQKRLSELGLLQEQVNLVNVLSLSLLAAGLVLLFSLYVHEFHVRLLRSLPNLVLCAVVVCGCLLIYRIGTSGLGVRFSSEQISFIGAASSALGAMLLASLLCPQVAVYSGISLAILTTVQSGGELETTLLAIVSVLVGVQLVSDIRNRAQLLRAAGVLSVVMLVTTLVVRGALGAGAPPDLWQTVIWSVAAGVPAVLLFWLLGAWLERPFRITTHLTLLELSDPRHPLLQRLQLEAPGTYHHSLMVSNLAERAAEAIGADPLFCRVASLYHDVGKVIRPQFFVENQILENRHNEISPSLSSLIIINHVRDGVKLAEEHRLPPPIIDVIREHHGTCLIKYFYHRAVSVGEAASALEYQFRYEGPRPHTKESGVIMLADSAEAAARTLEKPTPGRIRDLLDYIVRDRLADGQLDDCELTFKDLERIVTSMTRALTSALHARVDYPKGETGELLKGSPTDGTAYRQSLARRQALADTPEAASAAAGSPGRR